MKFLCEQCKAKYQIADDKVAGKTVRMKCRKCGHMIEVRAEVTETSVAQGLPQEDAKKSPSKPKTGLATSLASTARPPMPKARPDALAGAFQRKVQQEPESTASLEMLDTNTSSGWYVAINGVPVGPIRISELRRKAANGAVNEDSLAWREGLEEWRPIRSITEIADIVREAMMSGRPSLVTPPPGEARQSAPPPAPAPAAPRPPAARPTPPPRAPEPQRPAPLAARSNVVPFTGRLATAEKREEDEDVELDEEIESEPPVPASASASAAIAAMAAPSSPALPERPSLVAPDPFALPPPAAPASAPAVAAFGAPAMAPAAAAIPPTSTAVAAPVAVSPAIVVTDQGQRKQTNWIAIGMVGAFIAFGITGAIVAFKKDGPQPAPTPVVVTVTVEKPVAPPPTETPGSIDIGSLDEKTGGKTGGKTIVGSKSNTATPSKGGNTLGIGDMLDQKGPAGGNTINPGGPGPSAAPRGQLTSDQVQTTLRNYQTGVKRTCWERAGSNINSANIDAKIVVASSGQVQSVDATGNEPVVAKCIENQVRNWHFPAAGETSTVVIPFRFVRQ